LSAFCSLLLDFTEYAGKLPVHKIEAVAGAAYSVVRKFCRETVAEFPTSRHQSVAQAPQFGLVTSNLSADKQREGHN
jgi:hypothetical protein